MTAETDNEAPDSSSSLEISEPSVSDEVAVKDDIILGPSPSIPFLAMSYVRDIPRDTNGSMVLSWGSRNHPNGCIPCMWSVRPSGCLDKTLCMKCHDEHDLSYAARKRLQRIASGRQPQEGRRGSRRARHVRKAAAAAAAAAAASSSQSNSHSATMDEESMDFVMMMQGSSAEGEDTGPETTSTSEFLSSTDSLSWSQRTGHQAGSATGSTASGGELSSEAVVNAAVRLLKELHKRPHATVVPTTQIQPPPGLGLPRPPQQPKAASTLRAPPPPYPAPFIISL